MKKQEQPKEDIYSVMLKQVMTRFNTLRELKVDEQKTPDEAWKRIYSDMIESLKILKPQTVEAIQLIEELGLYEHRYYINGLLSIFEDNANFERMRCLGYGLPSLPIEKPLTTLQYPIPLIDGDKRRK